MPPSDAGQPNDPSSGPHPVHKTDTGGITMGLLKHAVVVYEWTAGKWQPVDVIGHLRSQSVEPAKPDRDGQYQGERVLVKLDYNKDKLGV
jgi:hypothetical protein